MWRWNWNEKKKDVNRDSHIAFPPISQSRFFEGVRCLIYASSQRKLCGYIIFFKFDVTIKKQGCGSGFPYCLLTDFTKFFLWRSTLLDYGFLTVEAPWIHRICIIWCHDKKNKKIKFVWNLNVSTDSYKIWYQMTLSISAFTQEIWAR